MGEVNQPSTYIVVNTDCPITKAEQHLPKDIDELGCFEEMTGGGKVEFITFNDFILLIDKIIELTASIVVCGLSRAELLQLNDTIVGNNYEAIAENC